MNLERGLEEKGDLKKMSSLDVTFLLVSLPVGWLVTAVLYKMYINWQGKEDASAQAAQVLHVVEKPVLGAEKKVG